MKRRVTLIFTAVLLVVIVSVFSALLCFRGPTVVRGVMKKQSPYLTMSQMEEQRLLLQTYQVRDFMPYNNLTAIQTEKGPWIVEDQTEEPPKQVSALEWYFDSMDKRKLYLCNNEEYEYLTLDRLWNAFRGRFS